MHWWVLVCGPLLVVAVPRFDPTAILRNVLVPADAAVGSVIYRLRASDPTFDYPLSFDVSGKITIASIETLNCTRFNSVCQANVILMRKLEPGRFYDFRVVVATRRGESASMDCSFRATNATTPIGEIFPGAPTLLMISENARRNTELGSLIAKGNKLSQRPVLLELWGSPQFSLRQRLISAKDAEGTIILLGKLDYEIKTVHHLTVLANDPWTEPENDSRNIAAWPLLVAVLDEQDTPPVFTLTPPTTPLDPGLKPGDVVLTVKAEDGDRGKPRDIRYGLVSEGNPFTTFFDLSEETGELRLAKPLEDILAISHSNTPIILTVVAEEVRSGASEAPAQSTTVQLALIPPQPLGSNPRFSSREYTTSLDENSPVGTVLNLNGAELEAQPGLVFTLELLNNNGTFDVSPNVVEGRSKFVIKVRDNAMLDYEARHSVQCDIFAKELGDSSTNHTALARLVVFLNDVNDNPPQFREDVFQADVQENAEVGTTVLRVYANDIDGSSQNIRYVGLSGPGSDAFAIDPTSGVITVAKSANLDAEKAQTLTFTVEAADDDGTGNTATATVTVNLIDVNDETPQFEKNPYEFILSDDRRRFTIPAFITAIDNDATSPNNEVRYEVIDQTSNVTLDAVTGELRVYPIWNGDDIVVLKVRAYDGGVPRLWSEAEVRIYPPDRKSRKMIFIVSGSNPDRGNIEEYLSSIIGAKVVVDRIRPYAGQEQGALDISRGGDRSVVETTVTYNKDTVIDIERIRQILDRDRQKESDKAEVKESSVGGLWWLLLVLLLLILLVCLILVLCCICEGCPLYMPPKKRRKVTPTDVERLVVKGEGQGVESKSVQVAEWFGRREAWTPEQNNMLDVETDSIRRHEMERGSDRGVKIPKAVPETGRDQLYIREGNADILRLITRGGEQQRPVTLLPEQTFVVDSGKDILMRRFIDQQQGESFRMNAYQQNTLNRIQSEHELLEASLRQQNALLRQILLDRERDLRLETQSLPAGTQTDHHVSTQTEPLYLRPPRRQTRSDNDASDGSDEEERYVRARRRRNIRKASVKRKIRTPIQEESESNQDVMEKQQAAPGSARAIYNQTKASILRKMKTESERSKSSSLSKSSRSLKKEILQEISDSLNPTETEGEAKQPVKPGNETYTDSLEDTSPRSDSQETSEHQRRQSAYDIRPETEQVPLKPATSHGDLSTAAPPKKPRKKSTARYMEWYNKDGTGNARQKRESFKKDGVIKVKVKEKEPPDPTTVATKVSKKQPSTDSQKKVELPTAPGPVHPLIQHSKNRFEVALPKRAEAPPANNDDDSGIALTRPAMAQKKSVFTIAYDDMATRQLPDSVTITP